MQTFFKMSSPLTEGETFVMLLLASGQRGPSQKEPAVHPAALLCQSTAEYKSRPLPKIQNLINLLGLFILVLEIAGP